MQDKGILKMPKIKPLYDIESVLLGMLLGAFLVFFVSCIFLLY
jgi:hypothetical protein